MIIIKSIASDLQKSNYIHMKRGSGLFPEKNIFGTNFSLSLFPFHYSLNTASPFQSHLPLGK